MNFNFLNSFLFHPRKSSQPSTEKDVLIDVDDNVKIGSRFHLSNADAPTIIFFHGNGEIVPEYMTLRHSITRGTLILFRWIIAVTVILPEFQIRKIF